MNTDLRIICGNVHANLGKAICQKLNIPIPSTKTIDSFADSETKVQISENVRGCHVFVIQPTCPPTVNEHLMQLLIAVDALRRASARIITAVVPYFGYARQDRKSEGRVPITAKLVANLMVTSGVNRLLTVDLHSSQIQGFFDIPVDHLFAMDVLIDFLNQRPIERPVVMATDIGSMKMAGAYAKKLGGSLAVVEKHRLSDREVKSGYFIGDVKDRDVVIVDDVITSGATMKLAILKAWENGAKSVRVAATHGLFVESAWENLREAGANEIVVTDSVPQKDAPEDINLSTISLAPLLSEAIERIYQNKSVSDLFRK